ncbi:hypothetical protein DBR37_01655 [Herminiimonas sp. KBW02]|uniref:hypothetical protein n=1 Tax=Herminiimonas sp. KBW02 TaxID=2153363 RepID=UPI000F5A8C1B|nr:hypothetical protein [Herminiimonas sp. KBW02]RQO38626.1 hypothetical protein DBR37_01655 [Herminiimonas sp. KBW02]
MTIINYSVDTQIDGLDIIQTVRSRTDGTDQAVYRYIIQTGDAQTREALIKLGWTPPKDGV